MSRIYLSVDLRKIVKIRASEECEYCLRPAMFANESYHIDHIIALKHGGWSDLDNLAWSCSFCNTWKGSDLSTYLIEEGEIVILFNPRKHRWLDHFTLSETGEIEAKTKTGLGTIALLKMNEEEKVLERTTMLSEGYSFFALQ